MNVLIINDESIEGNETFTIYLTSDVGVNVSPYVQTEVTIIDDDEDDEDDDDGKLLGLCSKVCMSLYIVTSTELECDVIHLLMEAPVYNMGRALPALAQWDINVRHNLSVVTLTCNTYMCVCVCVCVCYMLM